MSEENNTNEPDGDELEAMFARAAMEEGGSEVAPTAEMHDPLSEVMENGTEEDEVDYIGGESDGEDIAALDGNSDDEGEEPTEDFIGGAISEPEEENTSDDQNQEGPVARLEDSILTAVELAHEAADLANDVIEEASNAAEQANNTSVEMRQLVQDALHKLEESQSDANSAIMMSAEMSEYMDELKRHSDAIRERTQQLRKRILSLGK